ncbi:MAG TPA: hypothetical protein VIJ92_09860 [Ginsengibacter sp.]
MTGTWLGYYKYDNKNLQKSFGFDKTHFTIIINSFDQKCFKGNVTDDVKSGGMEDTGEIVGQIDGENISFKKLMPRKSIIYPNGELKYLDKKHPILFYRGKFSKDKREISGEWKFKITIGLLFGFIPFPYRPGKGTWSMTLQ